MKTKLTLNIHHVRFRVKNIDLDACQEIIVSENESDFQRQLAALSVSAAEKANVLPKSIYTTITATKSISLDLGLTVSYLS